MTTSNRESPSESRVTHAGYHEASLPSPSPSPSPGDVNHRGAGVANRFARGAYARVSARQRLEYDFSGLVAIVAELSRPCACETVVRRKDCGAAPLQRWWEDLFLTSEQRVELERRRVRDNSPLSPTSEARA